MSKYIFNLRYKELFDKLNGYDDYKTNIDDFIKDKTIWQNIIDENSKSSYKRYLQSFPDGLYAQKAKDILKKEEELWNLTLSQLEACSTNEDKIKFYNQYISKTILKNYTSQAKEIIKKLEKETNDEEENSLWKETLQKIEKFTELQDKITPLKEYLRKSKFLKYKETANLKISELEEQISLQKEKSLWDKTQISANNTQDLKEKLSYYNSYLTNSNLKQYKEPANNEISKLEKQILHKEEEHFWKVVQTKEKNTSNIKDKISIYKDYLAKSALKKYESDAKKQINFFEEEIFWEEIKAKNAKEYYESYLEIFQNGRYKKDAIRRIDNFIYTEKENWQKSKSNNTKESYENYLTNFPNGLYKNEAIQKIDEFIQLEKEIKKEKNAWSKVKKIDKTEAYVKYLKKYPNGLYKNEASLKLLDAVATKIDAVATEIIEISTKTKEREEKQNNIKKIGGEYIYEKYCQYQTDYDDRNPKLIGVAISYYNIIPINNVLKLLGLFLVLTCFYIIIFSGTISLITYLINLKIIFFLKTLFFIICILIPYTLLLGVITNFDEKYSQYIADKINEEEGFIKSLLKIPTTILTNKNILSYYLFPFNKINYNKWAIHFLIGEKGFWLYNEIHHYIDVKLYKNYNSVQNLLKSSPILKKINSRFLKKLNSSITNLFNKNKISL